MIINKKEKINILMLSILFAFILPATSSAQTVSVESDNITHNVGDSFLVKINLDSMGKSINSLGGTVVIPSDSFDVSLIQTGDSFISLWTERPELINGEIHFSGGLPGGYSGSLGTIFTFALSPKKKGVSEIKLKDIVALLNDGKGTLIPSIKIIPLDVSVKSDASIPKIEYLPEKDVIPPEDFNLSVSHDPNIENNNRFVSFFAIDKGSGIKGYEVEEDPWIISLFGFKKIWTQAESPQILYYQKWPSTVKVSAIDMAGNTRTEEIIKW